MHPVYMTIGNIPKSVRAKIGNRAYLPIAYLPVSKFSKTEVLNARTDKELATARGLLTRRLFHEALGVVTSPLRTIAPHLMVDASGFLRHVVMRLMAYIADLEEQWLLAALMKNECPNCLADYHDLDAVEVCAPRTSNSILADIKRVRDHSPTADTWEFALLASDFGLCGVEHPFWELIPGDFCRRICQDLLHGLYKGFGDHDAQWLANLVGSRQLDNRFRAFPHRTGHRSFPRGISCISQWTGKEQRDRIALIASAVSGADEATPKVINALRDRLDFIYSARSRVHTDKSLKKMALHVRNFHKHRHVFLDLGARRGGKNKRIKHMRFPKGHSPLHFFPNIVDTGTSDNYSTEASETMHISSCKEPYKASNRREYAQQVTNMLDRAENVFEYKAYLSWQND